MCLRALLERFWISFYRVSKRTRRRTMWSLLLLVSVIGLGGSCAAIGKTEVVLVPATVDVDGVPYSVLRLAEPVEARVYVRKGGQLVRSMNRVALPEGWMIIPAPPAARNLEEER